jgi:WD40 repeat protein
MPAISAPAAGPAVSKPRYEVPPEGCPVAATPNELLLDTFEKLTTSKDLLSLSEVSPHWYGLVHRSELMGNQVGRAQLPNLTPRGQRAAQAQLLEGGYRQVQSMLPEFSNAIFSPNGRQLIGFHGLSNTVHLRTVSEANGPISRHVLEGSVSALAFTPDSRGFVSARYDGKLERYDLDGGLLASRDLPAQAAGLSITPGGQLVVGLRDGKTLLLQSIEDPSPVQLPGSEICWSLQTSPDGRFAAGAHFNTVSLFDLTRPGAAPRVIANPGGAGQVQTMDFSPDGKTLALAWRGRLVQLIDVSDGAVRTVGAQAPHAARFAPTGELLLGFQGTPQRTETWSLEGEVPELKATLPGVGLSELSPSGAYHLGKTGQSWWVNDFTKPQPW